jgi:hypothetical protein
MAWAWLTKLPPTPKLVLTALADIADDQGLCWPSVRAMAQKCSLSERSVQRILQSLQSQQLLSIEPQFRKDGSRSSNRYRLVFDSPPPGQVVGGWGHRCQGVATSVSGGGDTNVTPRTTNEPSINTSQQRCANKPTARPVGPVGTDWALTFPEGLDQRQQEALRQCVSMLAPEKAQQVLDELARRMRVAKIKYPVRYCAALVARWSRRGVTPETRHPRTGEPPAAEHASGLLHPHQTPLGTTLDAKSSRLPARMRASLNRIRDKLHAHSAGEPTNGNRSPLVDDPGSSER